MFIQTQVDEKCNYNAGLGNYSFQGEFATGLEASYQAQSHMLNNDIHHFTGCEFGYNSIIITTFFLITVKRVGSTCRD